jgi:hypothetical protein
MMAVHEQYQIRDQVNSVLRPKRSAAWPSATTPNHRPANVENTKVPKPATRIACNEAKIPRDCCVNNPLSVMPGAT